MPHRATLYKQRATFCLTVPQRTIALTRLLNYIELLHIARYGFEELYFGEDNGDYYGWECYIALNCIALLLTLKSSQGEDNGDYYGFVAENSRD